MLFLTAVSALALSATAIILPRTTQAVATPVSVRQLVEEGDRQLAADDFAGAQAATLFLWVVRYGEPDREEVRLAREWLEAAQIEFASPPR